MLLDVRDLSIGIQNESAAGFLPAVEDLSFSIGEHEIFGLVGESGCGKSLTALAVAGLLPDPAIISGGSIYFQGSELTRLSAEEFRRIQGGKISMIFQEPMTSLNPLMTVGRQVAENLRLHTTLTAAQVHQRTVETLAKTGLPDPERVYSQYPHQLSGGMRQRAMIAMAVICHPALLIADEPTTALDVTVQARILSLLRQINKEFGTAILFISHDLGVVSRFCSRVGVMYAGRMAETGTAEEVFTNPRHEYTKGLIASIPSKDRKGRRLESIPGRVPSLGEKKAACAFAPRCARAVSSCFSVRPGWTGPEESHQAACIYANEKTGGNPDE